MERLKVKKLLLLPLLLFVLIPSVVLADADPTITLIEAQGFQCLLTQTATTGAECDMGILIRYELPKTAWRFDADDVSTSTEPTVPYMAQAACTDDDEGLLFDGCYTSLESGIVSHSFYSGAHGSSLVGARTPPRVSHALSMIYVGPGHGLTFGDTSYETCLEPATTVFTPATPQCLTISWNTVTDADVDGLMFDDATVINATALIGMMSNLQAIIPGPDILVVNGKITPLGQVIYTDAAFTGFAVAAPTAFQITVFEQEGFAPSVTPTAFELAIDAEASASDLDSMVTSFNNKFLPGVSKQLTGGVLFLFVAGIVAYVILKAVNDRLLGTAAAAMGAFCVVTVGVLSGMVDANLYWIVLLLFTALAAISWTRDEIPG